MILGDVFPKRQLQITKEKWPEARSFIASLGKSDSSRLNQMPPKRKDIAPVYGRFNVRSSPQSSSTVSCSRRQGARQPQMPLARSVPNSDPRQWYQLNKRAKHQLREEPLCRYCLQDGKAIPTVIVDHVVPHRENCNEFRLDAVQSLCCNCYESRKKLIEHRGYDPTIAPDGYPVDPRYPALTIAKQPSRI
jgi:5-methylcytosine-specific restriction enzyme A